MKLSVSKRRPTVASLLRDNVDGFGGQKSKATQYMASHMREVMMYSLRRIALEAGVSPATLVSLAKDLGYDSYNELKANLQEEETGVFDHLGATAPAPKSSSGTSGMDRLANSIASSDIRNITGAFSPRSIALMSDAAAVIAEAPRVFVVGMRASHGVAHYLAHLLHLVRDNVTFIDDVSGMRSDLVAGIGAKDILIAFGFYPYVRMTLDLVSHAEKLGARIIAITDSRTSAIGRRKGILINLPIDSPWVFASMTSAMVVSHVLTAQIIKLGGKAVLERARTREKLLMKLGVSSI